MTPFGLLFIFVGLALFYWGWMLMTNQHGARDWWIDFSERQRNLFGIILAPIRYDEGRTQVLGGWTMVLGLIFFVAGLSVVF